MKCEKCGLCCKMVNCMHLTEDNLCSIYEQRPVVCNVDKTYKTYFARVMSKEEFEQMNRQICATLQES